jgi:2-dehydropantoate 2-reductase
MNSNPTIYILGAGAIGFPLAVYLATSGREVIAVRTSKKDGETRKQTVTAVNGPDMVSAEIEMTSLANLAHMEGMIVITAKSYANATIARQLMEKAASGPVVILQNGIGVEAPFLEGGFPSVYRCVLYYTSQPVSEYKYSARPINKSPVGIIKGSAVELEECVRRLDIPGFPFRVEMNIQREIWKKAIINSVFNSICPLLEVDNGIFQRDKETATLARELVKECLAVTGRLNIDLSEGELMDQIMQISRGSDGQFISTLQDIRSGRQTEIEFFNLTIARIAASMQPAIRIPKTETLGRMISLKSTISRKTIE